MEIKWFDSKKTIGQASFYQTNITLNTIASIPLAEAYRVKVGISKGGDIVIEPLPKERVLRGDLYESSIYQIGLKKSYSRISSTLLMSRISAALGVSFNPGPIRYETTWDEGQRMLIIHASQKGA